MTFISVICVEICSSRPWIPFNAWEFTFSAAWPFRGYEAAIKRWKSLNHSFDAKFWLIHPFSDIWWYFGAVTYLRDAVKGKWAVLFMNELSYEIVYIVPVNVCTTTTFHATQTARESLTQDYSTFYLRCPEILSANSNFSILVKLKLIAAK